MAFTTTYIKIFYTVLRYPQVLRREKVYQEKNTNKNLFDLSMAVAIIIIIISLLYIFLLLPLFVPGFVVSFYRA